MKASSSRLVSVLLRKVILVVAGRLVERSLDLGVEDDAARRRHEPLAAPLVLDRILVRDGPASTANSTSSSVRKRLSPFFPSALAMSAAVVDRGRARST